MIKLNWYVLTKPHVVHRYYRIKDSLKMLNNMSFSFKTITFGADSDGKPTILKCENTK